ncbi:long-chain fatty acid--CoA ligase [Rhodococcus sp. ABRD24]|uniref:AMP-dependent synthetase/ligase n=1 Tax=Rhodococcus sp. ABRD24 TaxID=2507582 RepID=UPI00103A8B9C|nr:long-chain fatty acid--CoA ligase [Rhodococcus sp. ABRD24]QBJ96610.1 long-chain fatty acid--CoA ligase [Rhodococcus sp. ABRD24]
MAPWRASDEVVDWSKIEERAPTVARMFTDRVAASPRAEAFRFPAPDGNGWASVTWSEAGKRVRTLAAGLIALGVQPEQRVALTSATRYEWVLADLAVMCAGAATTTVYPTTTASDITFIVANSGSRVVVAEDEKQLAKLREHRDQLPDVQRVVLIDGPAPADDEWVIGFDDLAALGDHLLAEHPDAVDDRIAQISPDSLATLIYTSGTTGRPKGVRLPHSAWTYEAASIDAVGIFDSEDLQYLWLPLSHVFGKILLILPLQVGFPTAVDGRVDKIVDNLAVVRPTFMGAAPRIFEKAYARIVGTVHDEGGIKAKIFDWALGVGLQMSRTRQAGREPSRMLTARYRLADRLVFRTIRDRFGGRLKFFVSGSAPLDRHVAQWFDAVGIVILEGYGLSETSAASLVNRPSAYRFGSVGWPIPGTEVRIAEDGEILIKGPGVMPGYHDNPEATAESLDADGWFHTGDIGMIDQDGFVQITDRKKDMFKTSTGKYVAPSAIAATFKGICPYVGEIIIHGEGKSYCVALISLDAESVSEWARENGMAGRPLDEIARSDKAMAMMRAYVDQLNAGLNRWEQVKKFTILERELTVESGEITPSMKLKRKIVTNNFADRISELYS